MRQGKSNSWNKVRRYKMTEYTNPIIHKTRELIWSSEKKLKIGLKDRGIATVFFSFTLNFK